MPMSHVFIRSHPTLPSYDLPVQICDAIEHCNTGPACSQIIRPSWALLAPPFDNIAHDLSVICSLIPVDAQMLK